MAAAPTAGGGFKFRAFHFVRGGGKVQSESARKRRGRRAVHRLNNKNTKENSSSEHEQTNGLALVHRRDHDGGDVKHPSRVTLLFLPENKKRRARAGEMRKQIARRVWHYNAFLPSGAINYTHSFSSSKTAHTRRVLFAQLQPYSRSAM